MSHLSPIARRLPVLIAAVSLPAILSCSKASPPAPTVKNVVVFLVDTLRPDHLGAYGYGVDTSPAIDALAARGVVFDNAFSQAPWTTPSIASMLTGLYPSAMDLGFWGDPGKIGAEVETLAEVLGGAGLRTHAVTARGGTNSEFGFAQGFEVYDEDGGYVQRTLEKAEAWLDGLGEDERFFLYLHTYDVHNFNPPGEYRTKFVKPYRGDILPKEHLNKFLQGGKTRLEAREFGDAEWEHVKSLYDGCIRNVDDQIALLVKKLEALGMLDDTLIVITADHGEEFGEHGSSGHGYAMYDESIRVPLVLCHPAFEARRVGPQVRLLDLAPTLCELLGVPPSSQWQGVDLTSMISGGAEGTARDLALPVFVECAHSHLKGMRTESPVARKLVIGQGRPDGLLLALDEDPGELKNVAGRPDEAATLAGMKKAMLRWVRTNRDLAARFSGRRSGDEMSAEAQAEMEALGYVGAGRKESGPGDFDWEAALGG